MKSTKLILLNAVFAVIMLTAQTVYAQKTLPDVKVKLLTSNQWESIKSLANNEGVTLISFWATWCKPCIRELNGINDLYEDWVEETNVKVIAISIDDSRSQARVPAFVNSRGWEFEVYSDLNSDLSRAMGVNNIVPATFIVDKEGNIVYRHTSYNIGDEEEYYKIIQEHSGK